MWLTENPWPPMIVSVVISIFFFVAWYGRRQNALLIGSAAMLVLASVIWWVEQEIVTEAERVEASVYAMAEAFRDDSRAYDPVSAFQTPQDVKTIEFISTQAPEIRTQVWRALTLVTVEDDIRVTDVQIETMSNNSRAVVHLRANATISVIGAGNVGRQPTRWEITWQKEGGDWKVIRVIRLNVITGEEIGTFAGAVN